MLAYLEFIAPYSIKQILSTHQIFQLSLYHEFFHQPKQHLQLFHQLIQVFQGHAFYQQHNFLQKLDHFSIQTIQIHASYYYSNVLNNNVHLNKQTCLDPITYYMKTILDKKSNQAIRTCLQAYGLDEKDLKNMPHPPKTIWHIHVVNRFSIILSISCHQNVDKPQVHQVDFPPIILNNNPYHDVQTNLNLNTNHLYISHYNILVISFIEQIINRYRGRQKCLDLIGSLNRGKVLGKISCQWFCKIFSLCISIYKFYCCHQDSTSFFFHLFLTLSFLVYITILMIILFLVMMVITLLIIVCQNICYFILFLKFTPLIIYIIILEVSKQEEIFQVLMMVEPCDEQMAMFKILIQPVYLFFLFIIQIEWVVRYIIILVQLKFNVIFQQRDPSQQHFPLVQVSTYQFVFQFYFNFILFHREQVQQIQKVNEFQSYSYSYFNLHYFIYRLVLFFQYNHLVDILKLLIIIIHLLMDLSFIDYVGVVCQNVGRFIDRISCLLLICIHMCCPFVYYFIYFHLFYNTLFYEDDLFQKLQKFVNKSIRSLLKLKSYLQKLLILNNSGIDKIKQQINQKFSIELIKNKVVNQLKIQYQVNQKFSSQQNNKQNIHYMIKKLALYYQISQFLIKSLGLDHIVQSKTTYISFQQHKMNNRYHTFTDDTQPSYLLIDKMLNENSQIMINQQIINKNKERSHLYDIPQINQYKKINKPQVSDEKKREIKEKLDQQQFSLFQFQQRTRRNDFFLNYGDNPFLNLDGTTKMNKKKISQYLANKRIISQPQSKYQQQQKTIIDENEQNVISEDQNLSQFQQSQAESKYNKYKIPDVITAINEMCQTNFKPQVLQKKDNFQLLKKDYDLFSTKIQQIVEKQNNFSYFVQKRINQDRMIQDVFSIGYNLSKSKHHKQSTSQESNQLIQRRRQASQPKLQQSQSVNINPLLNRLPENRLCFQQILQLKQDNYFYPKLEPLCKNYQNFDIFKIAFFDHQTNSNKFLIGKELLIQNYFNFTSMVEKLQKIKIPIYRDLSRLARKVNVGVTTPKENIFDYIDAIQLSFKPKQLKFTDLMSVASGRFNPQFVYRVMNLDIEQNGPITQAKQSQTSSQQQSQQIHYQQGTQNCAVSFFNPNQSHQIQAYLNLEYKPQQLKASLMYQDWKQSIKSDIQMKQKLLNQTIKDKALHLRLDNNVRQKINGLIDLDQNSDDVDKVVRFNKAIKNKNLSIKLNKLLETFKIKDNYQKLKDIIGFQQAYPSNPPNDNIKNYTKYSNLKQNFASKVTKKQKSPTPQKKVQPDNKTTIQQNRKSKSPIKNKSILQKKVNLRLDIGVLSPKSPIKSSIKQKVWQPKKSSNVSTTRQNNTKLAREILQKSPLTKKTTPKKNLLSIHSPTPKSSITPTKSPLTNKYNKNVNNELSKTMRNSTLNNIATTKGKINGMPYFPKNRQDKILVDFTTTARYKHQRIQWK